MPSFHTTRFTIGFAAGVPQWVFQREDAKRRKRLEAFIAPTSVVSKTNPLRAQPPIAVDRLGIIPKKGAAPRKLSLPLPGRSVTVVPAL